MSSELPPNQNDRHELEARLTALLLGELPAGEAAALNAAIANDAELAQLYERLKITVQLVRETAMAPTPALEGTPLKLSANRREKLLAQFKTVAPKEFAMPQKRNTVFKLTIVDMAAVLAILAILAGMMLPALSASKSRSKSVVVLTNLRQIEVAKQMWATEHHASPDAVPTAKDLRPYFGGGVLPGEVRSASGETYVIGKVSESPVAELRKGGKQTQLSLNSGGWKPVAQDGETWAFPTQFKDGSKPGTATQIAKRDTHWQTRYKGDTQSSEAAPPQALHYQIALPQTDLAPPAVMWSVGENSGSSHDGWSGDANKDNVRSGVSEPSKPAVTSNGLEPRGQAQGESAFSGHPIDPDSLITPRAETPNLVLNYQTSPAAPAPASPPAAGTIVLPWGDPLLQNSGGYASGGDPAARSKAAQPSDYAAKWPAPALATNTAGESVDAVTGLPIGNPEWIGMLHQPAPAASATNHFVGRNATIVQEPNETLMDAVRVPPPGVTAPATPPSLASNEHGAEASSEAYGVAGTVRGRIEPSQSNQPPQPLGWTDNHHTKNGGAGLADGNVRPLSDEAIRELAKTGGPFVIMPSEAKAPEASTNARQFESGIITGGATLVPGEAPLVAGQNNGGPSSVPSSSALGLGFEGGDIGGRKRAIDGDVLSVDRSVDEVSQSGKRLESNTANTAGTPVLGDIPTTGHLFRKPEEAKPETHLASIPPAGPPDTLSQGGQDLTHFPSSIDRVADQLRSKTTLSASADDRPFDFLSKSGTSTASAPTNAQPEEHYTVNVVGYINVPVSNGVAATFTPEAGLPADANGKDVLGRYYTGTTTADAKSLHDQFSTTNAFAGDNTFNYELGVSGSAAETPLTRNKPENPAREAEEANRRELAEKEAAQVTEMGRGEKTAVINITKSEGRTAGTTHSDVLEEGKQTAELLSTDLHSVKPIDQTVEQGTELQMAKADLERIEKFRDTLALREAQEKADAASSDEGLLFANGKSRIMAGTQGTIGGVLSPPSASVDPAKAQPDQKPGLGQRIKQAFTGKVERFARVNVQRDADVSGAQEPRVADATTLSYDPYFVATEREVIQSEPVLDKAIEKLKLDEAWAGKDGKKLTIPETRALLRKRLDLRAETAGSVLDIGVKSGSPEEAAKIANAVAVSYAEHRTEERNQLTLHGIKEFETKLAEYDQHVAQAKQKVAELEKRSGAEPAAIPTPATDEDRPIHRPAAPVGVPQPEVQTSDNAFSTFSMNVSDVSWKLAAASLEKGQMPEAASVRSEEFLNAFDYRDPEPPAGVPIGFAWERAQYPFAQNRDLLRFSVKTAAEGRQSGCPMNIVLLLDNSGSMERADRVRIIHEALRVLATQLQPQDKLSVVLFARTARLLVDGVSGDQAAQVAEEVGGLTPQGGTNLEEAMNLAYQTALRHYLARGVNRVVLLTDGAANLGNVDPEALKQKVEANRKQGVALDCFGIGWEGYNDDLLEVLSSHGDGRYAFLNTPEDAATDFVGKLAGALHVAAADCKVQVEFNPKRVTAYRQIGYAKFQLTKEQFRDNTVDAAEIGAAESGNSLYVIEVNPRGEGPLATVRVRYKVPGTSDYPEHEWSVPYTGSVPTMEHASPAMRLAGTASAFSEWLVSSPYAAEVTPDRLLALFSGVPEVYGADERPKKLEWMIRQANSIEGK
jgi:Mg-chelatase subunit ChlD